MWASIGRWTVHLLFCVAVLFAMTVFHMIVGYESVMRFYEWLLLLEAFLLLGCVIHRW